MFTLKRGATSGRNVTSEQKERAPRIKGNMPNLKLTQKRSVAKLEAMEDMNPMLDTIDEAASNEQRRYCYIVATIRAGDNNIVNQPFQRSQHIEAESCGLHPGAGQQLEIF